MKTRSILLSAILMAAITPAFAQATSGTQGMKMDQSMPMHQNGSDMRMMNCMQMHNGMKDKNTKSGQGMQDMPMGKNMPCANQTAQGTGVIEAIDTVKGTVTIKHQAIASIGWPAMTMTFKADPPSLLKNVKVGEKVSFTLHPDGMKSTVTAIEPARP
ncbi:MAG TPA: copper-binding protein [Rhodanobacteraceae bacterium]|jgi:Cu/Ag efflux protein CusF|nr:copper-binding protein [Rhodanobacteraceae bacterium]